MLLAPSERMRMARFLRDAPRREYLVGRALVRCALSLYADVDPVDWGFAENAYGRPEIAFPASAAWLRFNLSHSGGMVACAVGRRTDIGIDVEDPDREVNHLEIGERFFAEAEILALRRASAERRSEVFFQLWTLKESYIKALGLGLSLPLSSFAFHIDVTAPDIAFCAPLLDDPATWQFAKLRIGRYIGALAARQQTGLTVLTRPMIPLSS
jgi:4'-phosphopantetheinyl transferase